MSKVNVGIVTFWIVFIIPFAMYFVGNFYAWLFANTSPDLDRMIASITVLLLTVPSGVIFGLENWE